jgi:hypothetical protein
MDYVQHGPIPADIGYRASASAHSRKVPAATFETHIGKR